MLIHRIVLPIALSAFGVLQASSVLAQPAAAGAAQNEADSAPMQSGEPDIVTLAVPETDSPPASAAHTAAPAAPVSARLPDISIINQVGWSWDVALAGGYAVGLCCVETRFWGRVRAGALYWFDPMVLSFGATLDGGSVMGLAAGVQASLMDSQGGLWGAVGLSYAFDPAAPVVSLSAGWALFGVEWQHRFDDKTSQEDAVLLQLNLPIGATVSRYLWIKKFQQEHAAQ